MKQRSKTKCLFKAVKSDWLLLLFSAAAQASLGDSVTQVVLMDSSVSQLSYELLFECVAWSSTALVVEMW